MAHDRLDAMRAFCRIVEVGSFSGAADSLEVAKTTISGQIQALEAHLGVKLLHRTTRKVSPTAEGASYYERARTVLDDVDELEAGVSQSRNVTRGRVRVEVPSPVGNMLIIPALPQFVEKYPEIHLDIGCSERVADLVQEGVDCAIRGGIISDQDLVCRPIGQMQFCLCASPKYLASGPAIFSPDDLSKHRHLGFKFPISGRRHIPTLHRGEDSFTLDHVPAMYFNSGSASVAASVAGLGIAFLPRAEAEPHFKSGALVEVLPDWKLQSMPMSLVYPYTRLLSARVRAFTEWATKLMAENPLWSIKG